MISSTFPVSLQTSRSCYLWIFLVSPRLYLSLVTLFLFRFLSSLVVLFSAAAFIPLTHQPSFDTHYSYPLLRWPSLVSDAVSLRAPSHWFLPAWVDEMGGWDVCGERLGPVVAFSFIRVVRFRARFWCQ